MVHTTDIFTMELCYVHHVTIGFFFSFFFFQITWKLIVPSIPRSIANLHPQFLAILEAEGVHSYAKNHTDCHHPLPFHPLPISLTNTLWLMNQDNNNDKTSLQTSCATVSVVGID
jgi:hypothetical protein